MIAFHQSINLPTLGSEKQAPCPPQYTVLLISDVVFSSVIKNSKYNSVKQKVNGNYILLVAQVKDFGIILDTFISLTHPHIQSIIKPY